MAREPTPPPAVLRPSGPVSERVIAPGDPGRAMRLAVALTDAPKMVNHHRGLWGYTGMAADGAPLTVQSTGLGGPSTAAVVGDLAALGARRIVRVGTCSGIDLGPGTLLSAEVVDSCDGTSRAFNQARLLPPPTNRTGLLPETGSDLPRFAVASTDLLTQPIPAGARARDRTSAGFVAAAGAHGLAAVVLLVVADGLEDPALHAAELELGRIALALLG